MELSCYNLNSERVQSINKRNKSLNNSYQKKEECELEVMKNQENGVAKLANI